MGEPSSNNFSKLLDGDYIIQFESGWDDTPYNIIISSDGNMMNFSVDGYEYEYIDNMYQDGEYTIKIVSYDSNTKIYQVVDDDGSKGTISEPVTEPEPGKEVKITNDNFKEACELWTSNRNKAISIYGNISNWDTSTVTDMSNAFAGSSNFNSNISKWDVSNVTNMKGMFDHCMNFNHPLNDWDVSNVTNMEGMFYFCQSFDQPLNEWERENGVNGATSTSTLGNVTNMKSMFRDCWNFNHPLNDWDVSNVTNMEDMFGVAESFNKSINNWDVSNVTNMRAMFYHCNFFDQPLDKWDVSNVTDMQNMFAYTSSFNQPLNNWNVSNVTNMSYMFGGAGKFNQQLNDWDVSSVINMEGMFNHVTEMNLNGYPANPEPNNWSSYGKNPIQFLKLPEDRYRFKWNNMESGWSNMKYNNNVKVSNNTINIWIGDNINEYQFNENNFYKAEYTMLLPFYIMITGYDDSTKIYTLDGSSSKGIAYRTAEINNNNIRELVSEWVNNPQNPVFTDITNNNYVGHISEWDVSDVTDMSELFKNYTNFLEDLDNWYMYNVTNTELMFQNAELMLKKGYPETPDTNRSAWVSYNNIKLSDGIYIFDTRKDYYSNLSTGIRQLIVSNNGNKIYDTINGVIYIFSNGNYDKVVSNSWNWHVSLDFFIHAYNEDTKEYNVHNPLDESIGRIIKYEKSSDNLKNGYYNMTWETGWDKTSYNISVSNDSVIFYEDYYNEGGYNYIDNKYINIFDDKYYFSIVDYDESSGIYTLLDEDDNKGTAVLDESKMKTDYIKIKNGIYKYNKEDYEGDLVVTNFGNNISINDDDEFYKINRDYFFDSVLFEPMYVESYDESTGVYTINEMGETSTVTLQPSELNPDDIKFKDGLYFFEWEKGYNDLRGNSFHGLIEDNGNVFYGQNVIGTYYYNNGKYKFISNLEKNFTIVSYDESTGVYNLVDERNIKGTAKVIELFFGKQITDNKLAVNKMHQDDNNIKAMTNDDTSVTNISSDDNNMLVIKNNDNSKMIHLTLNPNTYRLMKLMMKNKK